MKIANAGDRIMNTWLYPIGNGWVMIDTGYESSYAKVRRRLAKLLIRPEEIRYLFLTHAHDDHAGFLNAWMNDHPHTQVVAAPNALEGLCRGQNSFNGGCSSPLAYTFCQLMALFGKGEHRYPTLSEENLARILTLRPENISRIEATLNAKILFTPGHTADSVSLAVGGNVFCGDAAMNGLPSSHRITIWVEDKAEFERSWEQILESGAQRIYPAHGAPFPPGELAQNKHRISGITLRPLK